MKISANEIDWKGLLVKKYLHYGLNELDCMVLFISDAVLDMQPKTLLTCDVLAPYMYASKDGIDSSLSNLMGKKFIQIKQEGNIFYSSLDEFKVQIFEDEMKDFALRGNYRSPTDMVAEGLYSFLESLGGPLSPIERDRVTAWLKEGATEDMIKEACHKSLTKNGHISYPTADRLILEMQRSASRKNIGVSTIDEKNRKNDALRRLIDDTDWNINDGD